jgi:hypothetical protein
VVDARGVTVENVEVSGCPLHGISIASSTDVAVTASDIHHNGDIHPPAQRGAGISAFPGEKGVSDIRLAGNHVHDNNVGIQITNAPRIESSVSRVEIRSSSISANANDGILVTAFLPGGSTISDLRIEDNESFCNGWPARGSGFSSFCAHGFMQRGPGDSQSGAGIDIIQNDHALIIKPVILRNRLHHNVFEGLAVASQAFSRVKVSGKRVVRLSGPSSFQASWRTGQVVTINNKPFKIDSVQDVDHLLLQSSANKDGDAGFAGPSPMGALIAENVSYENGNAARSVGPGFYSQLTDGNVYQRNRAWRNNFEGFENYYGSFTRHEDDVAFSNNTANAGGRGSGFAAYGGLNNVFVDIKAYDLKTPRTQQIGINIGRTSTSTLVKASSRTATLDAGVNTNFVLNREEAR